MITRKYSFKKFLIKVKGVFKYREVIKCVTFISVYENISENVFTVRAAS